MNIDNYVLFSWAFLACLLGVSCALALALFAYDKYRTGESTRRSSLAKRDNKDALDAIGEGSVYQFFLG